jgi:Putative peptidoglycan-binding domain-containing protein
LVQLIQQALKDKGYYSGICDGIFEGRTEKSICQWQKEKNIPLTGQVNQVDLNYLGIVL